IWGEYFNGIIDEVRIYNRALSQAEIQSDMNTALGSGSPPPAQPAPPPSDTSPPTQPSNLVVTSTTQTSVSLSWGASSDNVGVSGYEVYKNAALAGTTSATVYSLGGLACGTSYPVGVDAYDAAGNKSTQAVTTATTAACSAPP